MSEPVDPLIRQYECYPYPPVARVEQEDPARDLRRSLALDLGLDRELIPSGGRVWVPGCGTRWAVMLGLQLRDVEIIGSDLSVASLEQQRGLARGLATDDVELREEDLLKVGYREAFDFISCMGVLHHLPDPDEGFAAIARALRPTGAAEIMVYDPWNRRHSVRMAAVLSRLGVGADADPEARFQTALRVLRGAGPGVRLPADTARVLRALERDPPFARELADFLTNPREHLFTVRSLCAALERAGLRVLTWKRPERFDPQRLLVDPELRDRARALDEVEAAELGHLLSQALLELVVVRRDEPRAALRPPLRRFRAIPEGLLHRVGEEGVRTSRFGKARFEGGHLVIDGGERRPAVVSYGAPLDCVDESERTPESPPSSAAISPEALSDLLRWASEPATLEELSGRLAAGHGLEAEEARAFCEAIARTPFRLLAVA